jgi:hypothetical protein
VGLSDTILKGTHPGTIYAKFGSIMSTCGLLLAHLAKGNVSFCHHLASVVCRPLTFHILIFSSETPQPYEHCKQNRHFIDIFLGIPDFFNFIFA